MTTTSCMPISKIISVLVQVGLGISTLLLHVPLSLAAAHQGGAVVLLSAMLFLSHVLVRQGGAGQR